MLDRYLLEKSKKVREVVAGKFQQMGLKADQVTWLGFMLGMCALLLIVSHAYYWALLFIILNRLADTLDGALARLNGPTDRGAFLDITLDFLFYSSVPLGFAIADPVNNALPATVLIYSFIGTGCSFLAFAVIAEKRGIASSTYPSKGFYYLGGLTESSETVLLFLLMCLFPEQFFWLAYGFAALCVITTMTRISAGITLFSSQSK
ncbi:CDP-alcohol phosphatidyltransferase family protein [Serratia sp. UGAL515B_01]|uniref:CDP-alcohol phosphatidyltransferase family protein n=1 Tax=Serratia sp. UGAL515B_01 TaxID=2986763 RepID=UPI0029534985|nr:CDP-alcohol phosphatidyltransferase family protein [Serratia sp. UGAL515B_01]WON77723.1 CDP-alcohol phosphatidyltransferase family protein [Serratia sp. UGAL515B_01]